MPIGYNDAISYDEPVPYNGVETITLGIGGRLIVKNRRTHAIVEARNTLSRVKNRKTHAVVVSTSDD